MVKISDGYIRMVPLIIVFFLRHPSHNPNDISYQSSIGLYRNNVVALPFAAHDVTSFS